MLSEQLLLGLNSPAPRHTFANYIASGNETVYHVLQDVIRCETESSIYLWGRRGTGKTHLLQAAVAYLSAQGKTPFYLPLVAWQQFSPEMLDGLETLDLVCLDDIQYIVGQPEWEQAVFHLFNQLRDMGTPLIISSNNAPNALGLGLSDLVSRFSWGGVYYLEPADDNRRREVLHSYAHELGLHLPENVFHLLLHETTEQDLKTLTQWIKRIDQASFAMKKKPNLAWVRHLLEGHLKPIS
jgi:DnaA-homolog protein